MSRPNVTKNFPPFWTFSFSMPYTLSRHLNPGSCLRRRGDILTERGRHHRIFAVFAAQLFDRLKQSFPPFVRLRTAKQGGLYRLSLRTEVDCPDCDGTHRTAPVIPSGKQPVCSPRNGERRQYRNRRLCLKFGILHRLVADRDRYPFPPPSRPHSGDG